MSKVKKACKTLIMLMVLLFGIGCFHSGFEYGEALKVFEIQGAIWTMTPNSILFFTAFPYVIYIGFLGIIYFVLNKYVNEEEKKLKEEEKKNKGNGVE